MATSSQAVFWATYVLRAVTLDTRASSDAESNESRPVSKECQPPFCIIIGGGQVGSTVARQLLDFGWPPCHIEIAVNKEVHYHLETLMTRGLRCTPFEEVSRERLSKAVVVILAIRPSNLEHFARIAAKHMPRKALLISCLSAVPSKKLRASLDLTYVIRTTVATERLPLPVSATTAPPQIVEAAILHAVAKVEDANKILNVIAGLLKKICLDGSLVPEIVSIPDFISSIVIPVVRDLSEKYSAAPVLRLERGTLSECLESRPEWRHLKRRD